MGEERVNSGESGCTAALRTIPAIVPACLNDPELRSRVAVTDLKARVPTIHVSPKRKPFSPTPCHLVQKCDNLLGGKLQRMTLKLSLNHHPSHHKGRPMDGSLCPCTPKPGLEGPPPGQTSGSTPGRHLEEGRGQAGLSRVPGSVRKAACISSHMIPPRPLQANAIVIPISRCRKLRLEGGSRLVFHLEGG